MQLIKRVLMTTVLITVLAPVINIQAAAESHEGSQVDQVNSGEEERKEAAAQSGVERIVWQELSAEKQEEMAGKLLMAADKEDIDEIRRLVKSGVPIDSESIGWTALSLALEYDLKGVVKVLSELGAQSNVDKQRYGANDAGEEEIKEAAAQGSVARIVWQDLSYEEQKKMGEALLEATYFRKIDEVRMLLESGVPIDYVNYAGWTALRLALGYDLKEMVEILSELSAYSYVIDRPRHVTDMVVACIQAICDNRGHMVKALLKSDMPVDMVDIKGRTLLIMAAHRSSAEVVGLLLNNERMVAHINDQDDNGDTALMVAIRDGHKEARDNYSIAQREFYIFSHDNVVARTCREQMIIEKNRLLADNQEKVRLLLLSKADTNKVNASGETALHFAVKNSSHNYIAMAYLLMSAGADVRPFLLLGMCCRDFANALVESNDSELLERLLNAGARVDQDEFGLNLLYAAIKKRQANIVYRLILAGARIERFGEDGGYYTWKKKTNVPIKLAIQKGILERDAIVEMVTGGQEEADNYGLCVLDVIRRIIGDYLGARQEDKLIETIRAYKAP